MNPSPIPAPPAEARDREAAAPRHQWYTLHLAGTAVSRFIRFFPIRRRFAVAAALALAARPIVRRTPAYRHQKNSRVDGAAEIAVHLMMQKLTTAGTEFVPEIEIDGYPEFVEAWREGRGLLLVAPHAATGILQLRIFHDAGMRPLVIAGDPALRVPGTRITAETLLKSPSFLLRARSRLREGRLVCAMLDRAEHEGGRTFEFETANGPVIVAPALLGIAARCGARVAFTEVHVEDGRLRGSIVLADGANGKDLARQFVDFVRTHVEERFARHS